MPQAAFSCQCARHTALIRPVFRSVPAPVFWRVGCSACFFVGVGGACRIRARAQMGGHKAVSLGECVAGKLLRNSFPVTPWSNNFQYRSARKRPKCTSVAQKNNVTQREKQQPLFRTQTPTSALSTLYISVNFFCDGSRLCGMFAASHC